MIKGADFFLKRIKKYTLLTNNSSKTKSELINIFHKYQIKLTEQNIINSIDSTIYYLKKKNYKNIYLFGTPKIKDIFKTEGFRIHDITSPHRGEHNLIVLTYHNAYTYQELIELISLINKGVKFVATHSDTLCPMDDDFIPDIGCILHMIYLCCKKNPIKILGKPNMYIPLSDDGNTLLIGDNIHTDYKQSVHSDIDFCLTLTGRTNIIQLEQALPNLK